MDEIKLPIEIDPIIKSYHYATFPMSIIQANGGDRIIPWLCKKYINCCFDLRAVRNHFLICLYDSYGVEDHVLNHQHICLADYEYAELNIDCVQLAQKMLSAGNYITGNYNEKYIPNKYSYNKHDYSHDYFLYGFDSRSELFYSLGYTASEKLESFTIPFENFRKSVELNTDKRIEFNFWKYNNENEYKLELPDIIQDLEDYCYSTNSKDGWKKYYVFGLTAMKMLCELFTDNKELDLRYTRAYLEHKYLMLTRLEYINKNTDCYLAQYLDEYENVYNKSKVIHNLCIKYHITGSNTIIDSIAKLMNEILSYESLTLPNIISQLKDYNDVITDQKQNDLH